MQIILYFSFIFESSSQITNCLTFSYAGKQKITNLRQNAFQSYKQKHENTFMMIFKAQKYS